MKLSQNEVILNHLINGGTLSRLEALFSYHIQNVTARVRDLRMRGIPVITTIKVDPQGAEYAEYSITSYGAGFATQNWLVRRDGPIWRLPTKERKAA